MSKAFSFSLTPEQSDRIREWMSGHDCTIENAGAIGGKFTFCFTQTSIGIGEAVKCACGQEIDVTEYDLW